MDLVIRNGTVATASDTFKADIGITGGRITAIAESLSADREIDASGKLVLPGGIEAHCHIAQESATGGMTADDYRSGSISAAYGGNSCFVPFAAQHRGMGVIETLDLYDSRAEGASVIDYGYHLIVADPTEKALTDIGTRIPSVRATVEHLSGGQRQAIELCRFVHWGGRLVLLDEPFAALGVAQTRRGLELIARIAEQGVAVVVITHNVFHAIKVAHRVVVLRHGVVAGDRRVADTGAEAIVRLITGDAEEAA